MAKRCPETGDVVLYLDCLECETKTCLKGQKIQSKEKEEKQEESKKN